MSVYVSVSKNSKVKILKIRNIKKLAKDFFLDLVRDNDILARISPKIKEMLKKSLISGVAFSLYLTDDKEIQQINKDYRKKDKSTDVITFSLYADEEEFDVKEYLEGESTELGEIIISADTALKQSKKNKTTFENEISTLLVHGILHLLGINHPDEKSREFVLSKQKDIVESYAKKSQKLSC